MHLRRGLSVDSNSRLRRMVKPAQGNRDGDGTDEPAANKATEPGTEKSLEDDAKKAHTSVCAQSGGTRCAPFFCDLLRPLAMDYRASSPAEVDRLDAFSLRRQI